MNESDPGANRPLAHEWNPITDLPADWQAFARPDIDDSLKAWIAERSSLKDNSKRVRLEERLATAWAIETGVIERLYTIDRGITETLIDLGLDALERFSSAGRVSKAAATLIADQRAALEFVFAFIRDERSLSISYIKELHQLLCRNQTHADGIDQFGNHMRLTLTRSAWKTLPNNPLRPDGMVHQYCPPEFVQDEMDALIEMHTAHVATGIRPEVEAAWLHHRFTQIHPFQDGNGRVARALATMQFIKADFLPLVIRDQEHREHYIASLEAADAADLRPLVSLFANVESEDLNSAITFVREIRGEGVSVLAAAAAAAAKRRAKEAEAALEDITNSLLDLTAQRLDEVCFEIESAFKAEGQAILASVEVNQPQNETWWHGQTVAAARRYGYFADLARPRRWVQLKLTLQGAGLPRSHVVVVFHHMEVRAGLMAAVTFLTTNDTGLAGC